MGPGNTFGGFPVQTLASLLGQQQPAQPQFSFLNPRFMTPNSVLLNPEFGFGFRPGVTDPRFIAGVGATPEEAANLPVEREPRVKRPQRRFGGGSGRVRGPMRAGGLTTTTTGAERRRMGGGGR